MTTTTVAIRHTRPGGGTLPGGIILRKQEGPRGGYVVHDFVREPGSATPTAFHNGRYFTGLLTEELPKALICFEDAVNRREKGYPAASKVGGSLIDEADLEWELEVERRLAAEEVDETEDMTP